MWPLKSCRKWSGVHQLFCAHCRVWVTASWLALPLLGPQGSPAAVMGVKYGFSVTPRSRGEVWRWRRQGGRGKGRLVILSLCEVTLRRAPRIWQGQTGPRCLPGVSSCACCCFRGRFRVRCLTGYSSQPQPEEPSPCSSLVTDSPFLVDFLLGLRSFFSFFSQPSLYGTESQLFMGHLEVFRCSGAYLNRFLKP